MSETKIPGAAAPVERATRRRPPDELARAVAAAAAASLERQGRSDEAKSWTPDVAAELGAHATAPTPRSSTKPARAVVRARARRLAEACEALDPKPASELEALAQLDARAKRLSQATHRSDYRKPKWRPVPRTKASRARYLAALQREGSELVPEDWSDAAWTMARAIFCDSSGREAERALARLPRAYAQRVRRAALCVPSGESSSSAQPRRWSHIAARRRVAIASVLLLESRATLRRGMGRYLGGFSRGMWCSLFVNPQTGERYSVSTLYATSHHNTGEEWDCGDFPALQRAGALYREQPPPECVPRQWRGTGRDGEPRALAIYWLTERALAGPDEPQEGAQRPRPPD
jgi:hypothetical protein